MASIYLFVPLSELPLRLALSQVLAASVIVFRLGVGSGPKRPRRGPADRAEPRRIRGRGGSTKLIPPREN